MTATKEHIYSDYLHKKVDEYEKEIGNNPLAVEILTGRMEDPEFDQRQNELFKKSLENIQVVG